jgi:hypothetical protein
VKELKTRRISRSLIEEEVKGPFIWYWSERVEVPKINKVVDLERMCGRRSVALGKFTLEIFVCGDMRTLEGQRVRVD